MDIENKKIIIYGINRFQRDFMYMFPSLKVEYYLVDSIDNLPQNLDTSMTVREVGCLVEEELSSKIIIICDKDKRKKKEVLKKQGLEEYKHFIDADILFTNLDFDLDRVKNGRKLAFWGTGTECDYLENKTKLQCDVYIDSPASVKLNLEKRASFRDSTRDNVIFSLFT